MTDSNMKRLAEQDSSRREFMKSAGKLAVYTAPAMLVLMRPATEAIAKSPGFPKCNNGIGNGADCLPPGLKKNGRSDLNNDD